MWYLFQLSGNESAGSDFHSLTVRHIDKCENRNLQYKGVIPLRSPMIEMDYGIKSCNFQEHQFVSNFTKTYF